MTKKFPGLKSHFITNHSLNFKIHTFWSAWNLLYSDLSGKRRLRRATCCLWALWAWRLWQVWENYFDLTNQCMNGCRNGRKHLKTIRALPKNDKKNMTTMPPSELCLPCRQRRHPGHILILGLFSQFHLRLDRHWSSTGKIWWESFYLSKLYWGRFEVLFWGLRDLKRVQFLPVSIPFSKLYCIPCRCSIGI